MKTCVSLLSGGLDSATATAMAKADGYRVMALSFRYGQRHHIELKRAVQVAEHLGVAGHRTVDIDLRALGGSALTSDVLDVPKDRSDEEMEGAIPDTYVPARNTIFLSFALAWAEVLGAHDIFIGVNAVDYSGYPDCRPAFVEAFERLANVATRVGVTEGEPFRIHAPLMQLNKSEIIAKGTELGVDYALTTSCYDPDSKGRACGRCDSCRLRCKGFAEAGFPDPTVYAWM